MSYTDYKNYYMICLLKRVKMSQSIDNR